MRRRATPNDALALTRLINEAYEPAEGPFYEGARITADEVREKLAHDAFLLEVDDQGALRACVHVAITGESGYFGLLAVSPAAQGQGLGRALAKAAEDLCREAGCRRLAIDVVNLRTPLFAFYASLGFTACGERPFEDERLNQPAHFVIMGKPLA